MQDEIGSHSPPEPDIGLGIGIGGDPPPGPAFPSLDAAHADSDATAPDTVLPHT